MKIIVVAPNEQPRIEEIENTLEAMQAVVGGLIQAIYPWDNHIALIVNEEGKLTGLPFNCALLDDDGEIADVIVGTFFLCYAPADSENFESLPDTEIDKYLKIFQ